MFRWPRRSLISLLALLPLASLAVVTVERINENVVIVSGGVHQEGEGGEGGDGAPPVYVIVTNVVGVCTNCTAVDTETINNFIATVDSLCGVIDYYSQGIGELCNQAQASIDQQLNDIGQFRRFNGQANAMTTWNAYTNYVQDLSVNNSQVVLDRAFDPGVQPTTTPGRTARVSYNNGIFDYASQYVAPHLSQLSQKVTDIKLNNSEISSTASFLQLKAQELYGLEPCTNVTDYVGVGSGGSNYPGDGGGDHDHGSTNIFVCAWTEEQAEAVVEYLKHIDADQHTLSNQLGVIIGQIANTTNMIDSYGRAITSALWTDTTIVVDDGEFSWSNVYRTGESAYFDYQRSNILQRIELLVYGMALGDVAITNALDGFDSVDQEQMVSDFEDNLGRGADSLESSEGDFKTAGDALVDFGESLCFLGAGSISSWSLGKIQTGDWFGAGDEYLEVPSDLAQTLNDFQPFFRTAFQVLYLVVAILWVWFFYARLFKYVVVALRFLFQFLNEAFG